MNAPLAQTPAAHEMDVLHDTHYRYASPVAMAHHQAHLMPLQDAHQQLLSFDLLVEPPPGQSRDSVDAMGNAQTHFSLSLPHRQLQVRARSRLCVWPRFEGLQVAASPAWDDLAQSLRYVSCAPLQAAVEYAMPSPYVPRLRELRDYARPNFPPGRPVVLGALALMQRLHQDFVFETRSTDVDTPLAQAFLQRRGVCQDFAHLMIGALRMLGLPARYVSGYLLTQAPDGNAPLVGVDASHAWVQLWCPDTPGVPQNGPSAHWLDLDPTNNLVPASSHVRLATGRDFGDVTPLRGVIRGGGLHSLDVAVTTTLIRA